MAEVLGKGVSYSVDENAILSIEIDTTKDFGLVLVVNQPL